MKQFVRDHKEEIKEYIKQEYIIKKISLSRILKEVYDKFQVSKEEFDELLNEIEADWEKNGRITDALRGSITKQFNILKEGFDTVIARHWHHYMELETIKETTAPDEIETLMDIIMKQNSILRYIADTLTRLQSLFGLSSNEITKLFKSEELEVKLEKLETEYNELIKRKKKSTTSTEEEEEEAIVIEEEV